MVERLGLQGETEVTCVSQGGSRGGGVRSKRRSPDGSLQQWWGRQDGERSAMRGGGCCCGVRLKGKDGCSQEVQKKLLGQQHVVCILRVLHEEMSLLCKVMT